MSIRQSLAGLVDEFSAIRKYLHQHPELSGQEFKTREYLEGLLNAWGIETHRLGTLPGLVGVLRNGTSEKTIALRADTDALPVLEDNQFAHASKNQGVMHACGHDGHMATLLMAARYLAETKNFDGTIYFYLQPAEEIGRGAKSLIEDGLLEKFPADFVFGCHNWPDTPALKLGLNRKAIMASGNEFSIEITGRGSHGAMPNLSIDPIFVAMQIAQGLQGIITRMKRPIDPAVLSICQIVAGTTYNVVPNTATIVGTVRTFDEGVTTLIADQMQIISENIAAGFGAQAKVNFIRQIPPLVNHAHAVDMLRDAITEVFGEEVIHDQEPVMPSEDFGLYLTYRPGAFFFVGNGNGDHRDAGHGPGPCSLHNASYDFNDQGLILGAGTFVKVVENYLR